MFIINNIKIGLKNPCNLHYLGNISYGSQGEHLRTRHGNIFFILFMCGIGIETITNSTHK